MPAEVFSEEEHGGVTAAADVGVFGEEAVQYVSYIWCGRTVLFRLIPKVQGLGDRTVQDTEVLRSVGTAGRYIVQGIIILVIVEYRSVRIEIYVRIIRSEAGTGKILACHVEIHAGQFLQACRHTLVGITIDIDMYHAYVHHYSQPPARGGHMQYNHPWKHFQQFLCRFQLFRILIVDV